MSFLRERSSFTRWQVLALVAIATIGGGIAGIYGVLTA
jgi:hypothetical protein